MQFFPFDPLGNHRSTEQDFVDSSAEVLQCFSCFLCKMLSEGLIGVFWDTHGAHASGSQGFQGMFSPSRSSCFNIYRVIQICVKNLIVIQILLGIRLDQGALWQVLSFYNEFPICRGQLGSCFRHLLEKPTKKVGLLSISFTKSKKFNFKISC